MVVIDGPLVRALIRSQFPAWADLPITAVLPGGVDHRTFRLGSQLLVRLPSAEGYAVQVDKEQRWLPRLAAALAVPVPVPVTVPVARGGPGHGYPFYWSVYEWRGGRTVLDGAEIDLPGVAVTSPGSCTTCRRWTLPVGPDRGCTPDTGPER